MKKIILSLFLAFVALLSYTLNTDVAQAAPPSVTFLINGGTATVNTTESSTVSLSWNSSGAVRCESSGSGSAWGYNPSLSTSGSVSSVVVTEGENNYILTCFSASGEKTTVMRSAVAGFSGPDCAVFPELSQVSGSMQITNMTTGATSSAAFPNLQYTTGPDLPASIGDSLLITYEMSIAGADGSTSMNGPSFRYGTSTATHSNATEGTFVIDSLSALGSISLDAGACGHASGGTTVQLVSLPSFSINCSPVTATITAGSSTAFNISTTGQNGFNSPVTVSHSINPNSGTLPSISYTNNGAVPPATTTAVVSTTAATTPSTYIITFSATGGSITRTCDVQLVVNAVPGVPDFSLTITPASASVLKTANSQVYTVSASCENISGPITGLHVVNPKPFGDALTYNFSSTQVNCGSSVTLTVSGFGNVNSGLSTPQNPSQYQNIVVSGTATP